MIKYLKDTFGTLSWKETYLHLTPNQSSKFQSNILDTSFSSSRDRQETDKSNKK